MFARTSVISSSVKVLRCLFELLISVSGVPLQKSTGEELVGSCPSYFTETISVLDFALRRIE